MMFLAMIIALILLQVWGSGERVQADGWLASWQARIGLWEVGPVARLAVVVLLPALVAQGLLNALEDVFFGVLWIALVVVLLLYSFGRGDFRQLVDRYRSQCRSGDFEAAYLATLSDLGWPDTGQGPGTPEEVHALVQRGVCYEGYQRWFAVLFYFVLLGPAGALAYRLLQLCRYNFEGALVERCLLYADWLPARLLAAAFSLTGDFVRSREPLMASLGDTRLEIDELLYTVGRASVAVVSLDSPQSSFGELAAAQTGELVSLMSRSAACWVALISLVVLLG